MPEPIPPANAPTHRVVVLPLRNISPHDADAYFADGMTEELISTLSKLSGLSVIARTSAMALKAGTHSIGEIGAKLGVRSVLEGSVRKAGEKVRISVQLVDVGSEAPLWSADYDRELTDVFAIQRDIAQRIARALKVRIPRSESEALERRTTSDLDAYTLYLQGRYHWNQRNEPGLRAAIRLFEQALAKDRTFTLALTGLADSYASLALLEIAAPTDAFPKARRYAEDALKLDPDLPEAHTSLGLTRFQYERDWAGAEAEFRRAISLNPHSPPAHQFFADYLKAMGRFDEALEEMRRALELDPLSLAISTGLGHVLYLSRRYDASIAQYRRALEMDPTFVTAHLWFGRPFLQKGMYAEAIAEVRQAVDLSGRSTIALAVLGHAYAAAGRAAEAREVLTELLARSKIAYLPSYWIGLIHTGLGDVDGAIAWLERAYEQRSSWLVWIGVEPRFDPLRSDARFQSLLRRMRLPAADGASGKGETDTARLDRWLDSLSELRLAAFRVVGQYTRFDPATRHGLKDLRARMAGGFDSPGARLENYLLWAPPGSGKTYFVHEVARSLGPAVRLVEINLAATVESGFRAQLSTVQDLEEPTLLFVDEADSQPTAAWPYELLLPVLEPSRPRAHPLVVVLAGSGGANAEELQLRIAARPKGADLLSRVPEGNRVTIPAMTLEDRAIVTAATVGAGSGGHPAGEIEKIALYFLMSRPELASPRQLRDTVARALARRPASEDRLKFDHLFDAGDPLNKEFWTRVRSEAPALINTFVTVSP